MFQIKRHICQQKKYIFAKQIHKTQLIVFLFFFCFSFCSLWAVDRYWISTSGNWSDTANWSTSATGSGGSSVPVVGDTAYIPGTSATTITIDADVTTGKVVFNNTGDSLITIDTNGKTLTTGDFYLNNATGAGDKDSNVKITGNGIVVVTGAFDFPNTTTNNITIESSATLKITSTYYGNASSGTMNFLGTGTLYIPASGANLNFGPSVIHYAGTLTRLPNGDPSTYVMTVTGAKDFPGSNADKKNITIKLTRSGDGTSAVSCAYTISGTVGTGFKLDGTTISDTTGSFSLGSAAGEYSFTISCDTPDSIAAGDGFKITIKTPDGALDLGTVSYFKGKPTWTGAYDSDWTNKDNWSGIGNISDITSSSEITINSGTTNYPVISSGVTIKSLTITANAKVTVTSGTLSLENLECSGYSKFLGTGGTVAFTAAASSWKADYPANSTFYNVTVNYGKTLTLGSDTTINGDLAIADTATLVAGAAGAAYSINVAGKWINNNTSGGFTARSSTVTFSGTNKTVIGANTFNNVNITGATTFSGANTFADTVVSADSTFSSNNSFSTFKCNTGGTTLTFGASKAQTITGTSSGAFTIAGADSNLVTLKSGTAGTQWTLTVPVAYASVDYAKITDSNSTNDSITTTNSESGGNNTNWIISGKYVWKGTTDTVWTKKTNWVNENNVEVGYPGQTATDTAQISSASRYPVFSGATDTAIVSLVTDTDTTLTVSGAGNIKLSAAATPLANNGTVIYSSTGRVTDNAATPVPINDTAKGTIKYNGASSIDDFSSGTDNDFYNLTVSTATSLAGDIVVANNFVSTVTVDGSHSLTVKGTASIGAAVGGTTPLGSVSITGETTTGTTIKTSGIQEYKANVILSAGSTFTSTGNGANGNITLGSATSNTVTGSGNALAFNTAGSVSVAGSVGASGSVLGDISQIGNGSVTFGGAIYSADITNSGSGNLTFSGAVTASNITNSGNGDVSFASTLSAAAVSDTGTGSVTFGGNVSVTSVGVAGQTNINCASVTTTGTQTYSGNVTLGANTALSSTGSGASGNISFGSVATPATVTTSTKTLQVSSTSGTILFSGGFVGDTALTTSAGTTKIYGDNAFTSCAVTGDGLVYGANTFTSFSLTSGDATFSLANTFTSFALTSGNATFSAANTFGSLSVDNSALSQTTSVKFGGNLLQTIGTHSFKGSSTSNTLTLTSTDTNKWKAYFTTTPAITNFEFTKVEKSTSTGSDGSTVAFLNLPQSTEKVCDATPSAPSTENWFTNTYYWMGSSDSVWTTVANWAYDEAGTYVALISPPYTGSTSEIVINTASGKNDLELASGIGSPTPVTSIGLKSLTIKAGKRIAIGVCEISTAGNIENNGTIALYGTQAAPLSVGTGYYITHDDASTIEYYGTGTATDVLSVSTSGTTKSYKKLLLNKTGGTMEFVSAVSALELTTNQSAANSTDNLYTITFDKTVDVTGSSDVIFGRGDTSSCLTRIDVVLKGDVNVASTDKLTFWGNLKLNKSGTLKITNTGENIYLNKTVTAETANTTSIEFSSGTKVQFKATDGTNALTNNIVNLTVSRGTFTVLPDYTIQPSGEQSYNAVNNSGTITVAAAKALSVNGNLTNSGTVTCSSGAVAITGTVANSGTITGSTGTVQINGNYSSTGTASFTAASGTTTTFKGSVDFTNTTFTHNSGTVVFAGTTAQSLTAKADGSTDFNKIEIKSGAVVNTASSFEVLGNWTNDGTFVASGSSAIEFTGTNVDVTGANTFITATLSGTGAINITGINTFTTASLTGSSAAIHFSDSNTFTNLYFTGVGSTVKFGAAKTQTVNNVLKSVGSDGNVILLTTDAATPSVDDTTTWWKISMPTDKGQAITTDNFCYTEIKYSQSEFDISHDWGASVVEKPEASSTNWFIRKFYWYGQTDTAWTVPANWSVSSSGYTASSFYPPFEKGLSEIIIADNTNVLKLTASSYVIKTLEVNAGKTVDFAGKAITADRITNYGTIRLTGAENLTAVVQKQNDSNTPRSSTIKYYGTVSDNSITNGWGSDFSKLEFISDAGGSASGSITSALTVNGTMLVANGTANTLTLSGENTFAGLATIGDGTTDGGTLSITSNGSLSIASGAKCTSLSITGAVSLNGNVTTTGTQTYSGNVALGGNSVLSSTGSGASGNITLGSTTSNTVTGSGKALAFSTAGSVSVAGAVGASGTALGNISQSENGSVTFGGAVYSADITNSGSGALTFSGAVTASNITNSGNGNVNFASTLSAAAVSDTGTGSVTFGGNVSATSVGVAGQTNINCASVTTTGTQTYSGNVVLGENTALSSTGSGASGNITLGSTTSNTITGSGKALAFNTAGSVSVAGAVGSSGSALGNISQTGNGSVTFGGAIYSADITNSGSGALTFSGAVTASNITNSGNGNVSFTSTLSAVAVSDTGTGIVTFGGNVSATSVSVAGQTNINCASVATTGTQTYSGNVALGSNMVFIANSTPSAAGGTPYTVTIAGTLGGGATARNVSFGTQTPLVYTNAIIGGAAGGSSNLLGDTTVYGNVEFGGIVNVSTLNITGTTAIKNDATSIKTTGVQVYGGNVSLDETLSTGTVLIANSTPDSSGGTTKTVTFNGNVAGGNKTFAVGNGTALTNAVFGNGTNTAALNSAQLSVNGTSDIKKLYSIKVAGVQTYTGDVTNLGTIESGAAGTQGAPAVVFKANYTGSSGDSKGTLVEYSPDGISAGNGFIVFEQAGSTSISVKMGDYTHHYGTLIFAGTGSGSTYFTPGGTNNYFNLLVNKTGSSSALLFCKTAISTDPQPFSQDLSHAYDSPQKIPSLTIGRGKVSVGTEKFAIGNLKVGDTGVSASDASFIQTGDNGDDNGELTLTTIQRVWDTAAFADDAIVWDSASDGGSLYVYGDLNTSSDKYVVFNNKKVYTPNSISLFGVFYDLVIKSGYTVTNTNYIRVLNNLTVENGGRYTHNGKPLTLGNDGNGNAETTNDSKTNGAVVDANSDGSKQNLGNVTIRAANQTKKISTSLSFESLFITAETTAASSDTGNISLAISDTGNSCFVLSGTLKVASSTVLTISNAGLFRMNAGSSVSCQTNASLMQTGDGLNMLAGNITTSGTGAIGFASDVYLFGIGGTDTTMTFGGGSGSITVGTNATAKDLYISAAPISSVEKTININSSLDVKGSIALFNGNVVLHGNMVSGKDIVLLNGNSSSMYNDGDSATGGASGVSGLFSYLNSARTDGGTNPLATAAPSITSFPTLMPDGTEIGHVSYKSTLTDFGGRTISCGKNFYDNGVDLQPNSGWNLALCGNDNALSAFAESYNMIVANCSVQAISGSWAWVSAAENVTDGTGGLAGSTEALNTDNTGWSFRRPYLLANNSSISTDSSGNSNLSGTYTIYDDVIRVEFFDNSVASGSATNATRRKIENTNNEISKSLPYIKFNGGNTAFTGSFIDADCTQSTNGKGDLYVFYLRTNPDLHGDSAERWNTDAAGVSVGDVDNTDGTVSTDRGRKYSADSEEAASTRNILPDLQILKAADGVFQTLRDVQKNRIAQYSGDPSSLNTPSSVSGYRFTATADRCSPVLIGVSVGQEKHIEHDGVSETSQRPYDSHNYIELQYSEPVDIGDNDSTLVLKADPVGSGGVETDVLNKKATSTFGAITAYGGGLNIAGFIQTASGKVQTGSRTVGGQSANLNDSAIHSLYRFYSLDNSPNEADCHVQKQRIRLAIAGYADGTIQINSGSHSALHYFWSGFIDELKQPVGNVTRLANSKITDISGGLSSGSVIDSAGTTNHALPSLKIAEYSSSGEGCSWDMSPPVFAHFLMKGDWNLTNDEVKQNYEILGFDSVTLNGLIDAFEFHFFDNVPDYEKTDNTENTYSPYQWVTKLGWVTIDGSDNVTVKKGLPDSVGGFNPSDSIANSISGTGGIRTSTIPDSISAFTFQSLDSDQNQDIKSFNGSYKVVSELPVFYGNLSETATDSLLLHLTPSSDGYDMFPLRGMFNMTYTEYTGEGSPSGFITDLAGNRLRTKTNLKTVDRTPPKFTMTVSPVDSKELYIVFNKKIDVSSEQIRLNISRALKIVSQSGDDLNLIDTTVAAEVIHNTIDATAILVKLNEPMTTDGVFMNKLAIRCPDAMTPDPVTGQMGYYPDIFDRIGNTILLDEKHESSDFLVNALNFLYAFDSKDAVMGQGLYKDGEWAVRDFSGSKTNEARIFADKDITFATRIVGGDGKSVPVGKLTMSLDVQPDSASISTTYNKNTGDSLKVWLPEVFMPISSVANTKAKLLSADSSSDSAKGLNNFIMPNSSDNPDSWNWNAGSEIQMLFRFDYDNDNDPLTPSLSKYCLRLSDVSDISSLDLWYVSLAAIQRQRGGTTILNNVINTQNKEQAVIEIDMPEDGNLTVQVLTLDGNVIKVLQRGRTTAGLHYYKWDGTNRSGDAVARGMYFIRIVGPGIDETRKVMAVKE